MFLRLGTPIQERQARTELDSIGGRRRLEHELTPVEQRIADLVAAGQTNREVAPARSRVSAPLRPIWAGFTASSGSGHAPNSPRGHRRDPADQSCVVPLTRGRPCARSVPGMTTRRLRDPDAPARCSSSSGTCRLRQPGTSRRRSLARLSSARYPPSPAPLRGCSTCTPHTCPPRTPASACSARRRLTLSGP